MKTQDELVELSRIKFPIGNGKLSEARMGFREGYKQCEQEQLNLHIVSECCGNPDIIQRTVTYQAPYETFDEMELTFCRNCKKSISAKFSNFR